MDKLTIKLRQQFLPTDTPTRIKFASDLPGATITDYHNVWVSFLAAAGFSSEVIKNFYEEEECNS